MSKPQKPFTTPKRGDSKMFQLTLNPTSGLPQRVCKEWQRRSFQYLPDALVQFRNPKTKATAAAAAFALIDYLKKELETTGASRITFDDITVGDWVKKFTNIETSPRTSRNAARNRPYSPETIGTYLSYYEAHIKGDPITELKMSEIEEDDLLTFIKKEVEPALLGEGFEDLNEFVLCLYVHILQMVSKRLAGRDFNSG
ncbi:hypothetical protein AGMMS50267_13380 [Spirochaetia bacterium]|nr:hypothetical protein AGMMS50267_13380 [Spirochaetia bacterium]